MKHIHFEPSEVSTLGKRVRKIRELRKLKVNQLAQMIGKKPAYLSRVEGDGIDRPNCQLIIDLALALNCRADFLLGLMKDYEINSYANVVCAYLMDIEPDQQEHCVFFLKKSVEAFVDANRSKGATPVPRLSENS
ncbi:MAG: helix-turn-helix transcriptional regulator [Candidatus Kapaibacterium sp.]